MNIDVEITPARRNHILANAIVNVSFETHSIEIHDFRVLKNRNGELWVAVPSYSIPDGRNWKYEPTVILDRVLMAEITEAVLKKYEKS